MYCFQCHARGKTCTVSSVKHGKSFGRCQTRETLLPQETRVSHVVIGPAQLTAPIGQKDVCTEYFNLDAGQHFFNQLNVKLFPDKMQFLSIKN